MISSFRIAEIGPYEAKKMLESNYDRNRNIMQQWVNQLASMMEHGQWKENGEPIIIHEDGTVLDGQHRLMACIKSGVPFRTAVVVVGGDKKEIYQVIDNGRGKTTALFVEGTQKVLRASVARLAYAIDMGNAPLTTALQGKVGSKTPVPRPDIIRYANTNALVDESVKASARMNDRIGIGSKAMYGIFYYIVTKYGDPTMLDSFVDDICDDVPTNRTALAARMRILKLHAGTQRPEKKVLLGLLFNAYDHYAAGDCSVTLNKWEQSYKKYERLILAAREEGAA